MMRGQAETESSRVEKQAPHQVHQVFVLHQPVLITKTTAVLLSHQQRTHRSRHSLPQIAATTSNIFVAMLTSSQESGHLI